jgi:ubiquitin-protein ligase
MKDKIDKLIDKFDEGNMCLDDLHSELLDLYNVTPRYSVSLVFVNAQESLLRCLITDATNEHEALGKALDYYKEETKGFNLSMKVVLPSYNVG